MITAEQLLAPQEVPTRPRSMRDKFFKRRQKIEQQSQKVEQETGEQQSRPESAAQASGGRQLVVALEPSPQNRLEPVPPGALSKEPRHGIFPPEDGLYPNDNGLDPLALVSSQWDSKSQREIDLETFELFRQGMSYRQIAHRCQISASTAYLRVRRGEHYASGTWLTTNRREQLAIDISRLEQIQRIMAQRAYEGDLRCAVTVINIIKLRRMLEEMWQDEIHGSDGITTSLGDKAASLPGPDRPPTVAERSEKIAAQSPPDVLDADERAAYIVHFAGAFDMEAEAQSELAQSELAPAEEPAANPANESHASNGSANGARTRLSAPAPTSNGASPSLTRTNGESTSAEPADAFAQKHFQTPTNGKNQKGGERVGASPRCITAGSADPIPVRQMQ